MRKIPALDFREQHIKVQVDAMEKIDGRDVYRVVGTRKGGHRDPRPDLFRCADRIVGQGYTTMQSVLGGFPEETTYEDYRDVSGLKVPFTSFRAAGRKPYVQVVTGGSERAGGRLEIHAARASATASG